MLYKLINELMNAFLTRKQPFLVSFLTVKMMLLSPADACLPPLIAVQRVLFSVEEVGVTHESFPLDYEP